MLRAVGPVSFSTSSNLTGVPNFRVRYPSPGMAVKLKNTPFSEASLSISPTPARTSKERTTPRATGRLFAPSGGAPSIHSCCGIRIFLASGVSYAP
jgi:hypothetical protein